MSNFDDEQAKKPWHKQPWLWFVLSVPIASVILSSIMVTVAVVGRDSLVSDNYYKDGMGINQTIEQDKVADELGLRPTLEIIDQNVLIELIGEKYHPNLQKQAFLTLKILHPTVGDKDQVIKLLPTPSGKFLGEILTPIEGRRYIDLYAFDESWRIREEVTFPAGKIILNSPVAQETTSDQP
jgi:hypothetical protein